MSEIDEAKAMLIIIIPLTRRGERRRIFEGMLQKDPLTWSFEEVANLEIEAACLAAEGFKEGGR